MSAISILERCRTAGVKVWADGERLRYQAPAPLPDGLLSDLRSRKAELLALLAANEFAAADADRPDALPDHIAELVERVCVWRIEEAGKATRFIVAGPDDDLSHDHPGAIVTPLFGDAHRERVRLLGNQDDLTREPT